MLERAICSHQNMICTFYQTFGSWFFLALLPAYGQVHLNLALKDAGKPVQSYFQADALLLR